MDLLATLVNRSRLSGNRKDDALLQVLTEVANAIAAVAGETREPNLNQLYYSLGSANIMTYEGEVLVYEGEVVRDSIIV